MDSRLSSQIAAETARLAELHHVDWSSLRGADLLLTGCTGPFGWWLLHRLSHASAYEGLRLDRMTVLTRQPARVRPWLERLHHGLQTEIVEADIREIGQTRLDATHVVHGATTSAAETSAGASDRSKFETVVDGTRALIRALEARPPRRLLYVSSGIAYGASHGGPLREDSNSAPCTTDGSAALGHAKRAAEFLLSCAASTWGASLVIARCFTFSGPGLPLDLHYALGNFVSQALAGDHIVINGDGTPIRSYMHLGDMAVWLLEMLTHRGDLAKPRIFNVGSDQYLSIRQLAELVAAKSGKNTHIQALGRREINISGNQIPIYAPIIERAKAELGLKLWTTLDDSISQMMPH